MCRDRRQSKISCCRFARAQPFAKVTLSHAAAEEARLAVLKQKHGQAESQMAAQHQVATAAAAALASARTEYEEAQRALRVARDTETRFLAASARNSQHGHEGHHCELCGQALRGAAEEVTAIKLREGVALAEGAGERALERVAVADAACDAASPLLEQLRVAEQVRHSACGVCSTPGWFYGECLRERRVARPGTKEPLA